jgi:hypothetical protein
MNRRSLVSSQLEKKAQLRNRYRQYSPQEATATPHSRLPGSIYPKHYQDQSTMRPTKGNDGISFGIQNQAGGA